MRAKDYYEAYLDDFDKIVVFLSKNSYEGQSSVFHLVDMHGSVRVLDIQSVESNQNYNKYTLLLKGTIEIGNEYYVMHQHARRTILNYSYIVKRDRFDELFYYDGDDLGYSYTIFKTRFALWAPTATRVKLELEKNNEIRTYEMKRTNKGVFRVQVKGDLENATYVYHIYVNGKWNECVDPYAISSIEDSKRSAIVDINKIKVKKYPLPEMKSACDAIIYEASVRDFTMQSDNGIYCKGKFEGFVEENDETIAKQTGFAYLKSLGITHVQLLPVTDFGSVLETHPLLKYNWGYDPVHYRVLEGSYSLDPCNPYSRMFGFVKLVEECHKAGIRVNVDVVFNHVYDKDTHYFEKSVPNYYFQMNENGDFSNGSFCGNDVDSKRAMCSKYIIDACKFLVKTYQIDGLRFDLMGILDIQTMNKIVEECRKLNPDFMVYGEGWDMPSFLDYRERASIRNNALMSEIAHFSDRFRDVVKGRTSAHEANIKGYCSGAIHLIEVMKNCLVASCYDIGIEKMFEHPRNSINYVECHDNMTCWDKLKECCQSNNNQNRREYMKLIFAAVILAQGIPFIHSGQEFARSKSSLSNTYNAGDDVNQLDYHRKDEYYDIVEIVRKLIAIRKEYSCFRYWDSEMVQEHVSFDVLFNSVLVYQIIDDNLEIKVIFNPTEHNYEYGMDKLYQVIYHQSRECSEELVNKITIPACQAMILCHRK